MREVVPDYRDEDNSDLKALLLRFLGLKDDLSSQRALNNGRGKFNIEKDFTIPTQGEDFDAELGVE